MGHPTSSRHSNGCILSVARMVEAHRSGIEVGFDSQVGPRCRVLCTEAASRRLRNVVLHRGVTLDADAGGNIDIATDVSPSLSSSRSRVVIGRGSVIAAKDRVVGDGYGLADYVSIGDHDHDPSAGPLSELHYRARPVVIGREVWIGSKAVLVTGVMIGDHAVVGAGAVVTRNVISAGRVGGVPGRPLGDAGHDEDGEGAGEAQ
jgi:acetyltransferase-like isoleucine patch superfamily enzyme